MRLSAGEGWVKVEECVDQEDGSPFLAAFDAAGIVGVDHKQAF